MDEVREIGFTEALAWLQALLGHRVRVTVNLHGSFAGCFLEGELNRIETLPPDDSAVNVVIAAQQGVLLDPEDIAEILLVGDLTGGQGWLEFQLTSGVMVSIELS